MDDVTAAKILIASLDLTSLNDDDNEYSIEKLCQRAITPYGNVAAVCVYPKFVPQARKLLKDTNIKIATVVNFPKGELDFNNLSQEIKEAIKFGADEIDAVFPYKTFLDGEFESCEKFLEVVAYECGKKYRSKIILETGEIQKTSLIAKASRMCINQGVNFIKTSTGKTAVSATPEAANIILETIASSKKPVGFKASGGIKTFEDAKKYLTLANIILNSKWISSKNFRIGASSVLDELLNVINRGY